MSVGSISQAQTAMQSMQMMQDLSTSVMRKELDVQKRQGEAAVELIQAASIPVQSGGKGGIVNTIA
ncbi:MAG: putative motility protein [Candidatus Sumerlaeia bacterium]